MEWVTRGWLLLSFYFFMCSFRLFPFSFVLFFFVVLLFSLFLVFEIWGLWNSKKCFLAFVVMGLRILLLSLISACLSWNLPIINTTKAYNLVIDQDCDRVVNIFLSLIRGLKFEFPWIRSRFCKEMLYLQCEAFQHEFRFSRVPMWLPNIKWKMEKRIKFIV